MANRKALVKQQLEQNSNGKSTFGRYSNGKGLFTEFGYYSSPLGTLDDWKHTKRLEAEAEQLKISLAPFKPPKGTASPAKHCDVFNPELPFPYHPDPYEGLEQDYLHQKWIQQAKILFGPFRAAGRPTSFRARSKQAILEGMAAVRKRLVTDWEGIDLVIYPNPQGIWIVRVMMASIAAVKGLTAYLNVFVKASEEAKQLGLVRLTEHWAHQPGDGHVYYSLVPPWVGRPADAAFLAVHPEHRSYQAGLDYRAAEQQREAETATKEAKLQQRQEADEQLQQLGKDRQALKVLLEFDATQRKLMPGRAN